MVIVVSVVLSSSSYYTDQLVVIVVSVVLPSSSYYTDPLVVIVVVLQNPFEEKGEPKRYRTGVLLFTSLTARPNRLTAVEIT